MKKSLIATCAALLVAVAVPSAASADELYSGTTKLPVGTTIVAESNLVHFGNVRCDKSKITGTLEENGKGIKIPITSISFEGGYSSKCSSSINGYKYEDTEVKISQPECFVADSTEFVMLSYPKGCSGAYVYNHFLYYNGSECKYQKTMLGFSVSYEFGELRGRVQEAAFKKVSGSGLCWATVWMTGSYTFTAPGYGPLHFVES